ncbi:hypothetical protein ACTWQB_09905 [Piscibacillus sp. B03]|uniref:hypothetical protein n=1 Tax=Piscibacillus sp. B03 TaxID=3457430 RepID=UPI003FCECB90
MKFYFLASVYNFELDKVLNRGINIVKGIRLSNSKARLDRYVDDFFYELAGKLEVDELYDKPFLYYEGNIEKGEVDFDRENERLDFLDRYLRLAQSFSNQLWLTKDNSVTVQQGFLYVKCSDGTPHSITSNMRTPLFFNAQAENEKITFNNEEIIELTNRLDTLDYEYLDSGNDEMSLVVNTASNRIERFNYFLQSTRTQTHLPSRLSMYCTLLETLLSTDKNEITHKISERLARILGNTYKERNEIFSFVKNAYLVRSSFVHGDKLPKKYRNIEKLKEMSICFDNYLRSLFIFILSDEKVNQLYKDDNNETLNEFFKEIVLK